MRTIPGKIVATSVRDVDIDASNSNSTTVVVDEAKLSEEKIINNRDKNNAVSRRRNRSKRKAHLDKFVFLNVRPLTLEKFADLRNFILTKRRIFFGIVKPSFI